MNRQFPCLEISRSRLRHNMEKVISRCTARGIQVCGVITFSCTLISGTKPHSIVPSRIVARA